MKINRLAALIVVVAACSEAAAPQDEVIKVDTTLVSVPVVVSDRQGRYVPGLKASDFVVFSDGAQQKIEFFASTEERINVALLIDTSHSTEPVIDEIKRAAERFVKLLRPGDKAAIVSFDHSTTVLSHFTSDIGRLNDAINRAEIPRPAGTTLRDAVYQTVTEEFAGVSGRKAIILLTDGKDFGSRVSPSDLLFSLQEKDVMIYSVFFKTGPGMQMAQLDRMLARRFPGIDPFLIGPRGRQLRRQPGGMANERAEEFLRSLTDTTAGRLYSSDASQLKQTFESIVEELRHQYHLGFYPADEKETGVIHELRVKVSRQDLSIRARTSYRAERK
jgi:Ca-activated chloride channel family protein